MSNFKLIAVGSIKASLAKAVELKRNTTISALFHGIVCNNVSFVTDMVKSDMADFDTVLRQLLPVAWDKANNRYGYSEKKALSTAETLGLNIHGIRDEFKQADKAGRDVLVQDFYHAVMTFYTATADDKKGNDLDAEAKAKKAIGKIKSGIKAAKAQGASDNEILDILAGMGVDVKGYVPVLERQ